MPFDAISQNKTIQKEKKLSLTKEHEVQFAFCDVIWVVLLFDGFCDESAQLAWLSFDIK